MGRDNLRGNDLEDRASTVFGATPTTGGRIRVSVLTRGLSILVAALLIWAVLCACPTAEQDDLRSSARAQRVGDGVPIRTLAFAPDGRTLGLTELNGEASLWDSVSGEARPVARGSNRLMHALAFAPDGRTFAVSDGDGVVALKDLESGETRLEIATSPTKLRSLVFAPDGRTLAMTGGEGEVLLWDLITNRRRLCFRGHRGVVNAVAFSPDGRTVASGGGERTITLWDPETGLVRKILEGHPWTLYSPDVKLIYLNAMAFSPDGATLATTALLEPHVRLWDVASGRLRAALPQPCYCISELAFAPDGRILATAADHAVTFWDVASGQVRPRARPMRAASLSPPWPIPRMASDWRSEESMARSPSGRWPGCSRWGFLRIPVQEPAPH